MMEEQLRKWIPSCSQRGEKAQLDMERNGFCHGGAEVCGEIFGKFICVGSYSIRSQFAVASGVDDKDFPPYFLKKEFFINLFL